KNELSLGGTLENTGEIELRGGHITVLPGELTLTGTGHILLHHYIGEDATYIVGSDGGSTLTNQGGHTILGNGEIGHGLDNLTLVNAAGGVIQATFTITMDTGGNTVTNAGTIRGIDLGTV